MVVDDMPENAMILRSFLTPLGYDVEFACTGEDALAMIDANPPDVILLDIVMPGMNGFEVCRRLKNDHNTYPSLSSPAWATRTPTSRPLSAAPTTS